MDPIREDLRELKRDIKGGIEALQEAVQGLGEKLAMHALEDADREGKVSAELGIMRAELRSLTTDSQDRQKFMRGWLGGLVAVAITAGVGYLFRSAIDGQSVVRPSPTLAAPVK